MVPGEGGMGDAPGSGPPFLGHSHSGLGGEGSADRVCSPWVEPRSRAPSLIPGRKALALWPLGTPGGDRQAWSVGPDAEELGSPTRQER